MTCKGICKRYQTQKPLKTSHYLVGNKRCTYCGIFIKWVGKICPCCGLNLRTKPRSAKYKAALRRLLAH